ncbi:MAG: hypothetical protein AAF492_03095 [Verrucomicrobiota bacterium]
MLLSKLFILLVLAALIVTAVRFLLVPGIEKLSLALNLGSKTRGKILGYATSTPELVIVIAAAAAGVFDAGFWNIASSNIINWVLFLSAVFFYRQHRDLKQKTFLDELSFGVISVLLPLALYALNVQGADILGAGLLVFFIFYKALDRKLNKKVSEAPAEECPEKRKKLSPSILALVSGVVVIIIAGWFLGGITEDLVLELGVSAWMIGWILGFVSSLPEMSGFFEVYRKHKVNGTLDGIEDTQEALDTLVASNMSNLGIILPIGVFIAACS